jgi:radical SAM superfamily enzyme YgiQ (UPF0313 family)
MVVRGWLEGQPITLSLKPGALTIALDDGTVLVFDHAGRLWSYYTEGFHFRRGLNGSVLRKWTIDGVRQRDRLWRSEADLVIWQASLIAQRLRDHLELRATPEIADKTNQIINRAAAFDVVTARADAAKYHQVYKPIGILPPDQYMALVLQVTEGCSFNTCTFCTFYKDRPFRIKSAEELRAHIVSVRAFLGESIRMRRGIFLADANALVVPQRQLVGLLDVIREELGASPEIYSFLDGFSGQKKSSDDFAALAQRGLRRVYVGLESGHDPLLAWVRKPGQSGDAVATVRKMKAAGVSAGVIVMLGLGGERFAAGHVRDTTSTLNKMKLGKGDLLYFSEFTPRGTLYAQETQMDAPDLWPLSQREMQAQRQAILSKVSFPSERPRIATYDIREFVY